MTGLWSTGTMVSGAGGDLYRKTLNAILQDEEVDAVGALLEADVNFRVVKDFVGKLKEKALGQEVLKSLSPGQQVIKIVREELEQLLGAGEDASEGVEAGVIVNMEKAASSIRRTVEAAEESADVEIGRVSVSIDGEHIKGIDSRGVIAVSRSGGEITQSEIGTVLEAAKTLALPVGRAIIDTLPQEFFVDGQRGIRDPVGMSGVRLGSRVHIVTASQQAVDNVVRAVRKAGLRTDRVTLKPLAASLASLSPDEKELGVLVVNLGAGTTGLTLYHAGAVRHSPATRQSCLIEQ